MTGAGSGKNSFTLVEMLVVIMVIGILAALLMPALQSAIKTARLTQCQNNLRMCGVITSLYAGENNNTIPSYNADAWFSVRYKNGTTKGYLDELWGKIAPYGMTADLAQCPLSWETAAGNRNYWMKSASSRSSYWYQMLDGAYYTPANYALVKTTRTAPSKKAILYDMNTDSANTQNNHRDNTLFTESQTFLLLDGHTELRFWPNLVKAYGLGF